MSIATLSAAVHRHTPTDELIGSMTKARIDLLVREAGERSLEDADQAQRWLAFAVEADVPYGLFTQLNAAFSAHQDLHEADLMLWYDVANTDENRENFLRDARVSLDSAVHALVMRLSTALGVSA